MFGRAYRNAAYTPATSAWTKMPLDTVSFDSTSSWDVATNHRFVIPKAGYYQVNSNVFMYGSGSVSEQICAVYQNGVNVASNEMQGPGFNDWQVGVSDLLECALHDYIELWYWTIGPNCNAGPSVYNWLSIAQVG